MRFSVLKTNSTSSSFVVFRRFLGTAPPTVASENDDKGFTTITMNKAPVNSLNTEMLKDLKNAFEAALANKSKGVILTSGMSTVFSAGLDILEMYQPKQDRLVEFWSTLQDLGLLIYGCKLPVVAVINGHSPAGGCFLSSLTDYRIMLPKFTIGLNETKLGIVAPFWFREPMINTVGYRQAELALQLGTLFSTEQAKSIGLIDEIQPDREAAMQEAKNRLTEFAKIPRQAFQITKLEMRRPVLEKLEQNREADLKQFVSFCMSPQVQKALEIYLESLKKRR